MGETVSQWQWRLQDTASPRSLWAPPLDGWPFVGGEPLRSHSRLRLGLGGREDWVREGTFGEVSF